MTKAQLDYDKHGVTLSHYKDYRPPRFKNTFVHHGILPYDWENYINNFDWYNKDTMYENQMMRKINDPKQWDMIIHDMNAINDDLFRFCEHWMKEQFNSSHIDVAIFKNNPGSISSLHKDNFYGCRIRRGWVDLIPDSIVYDTIEKYWIPLQDRKMGHFFECDGIALSDWRAGDMWRFAKDRVHLGVTVGVEPRYFLSINAINDKIWNTL